MMVVTHEMEFTREVANRVLFMADFLLLCFRIYNLVGL